MKNILEGTYIIQLLDIKDLDYSNIKDTFLDKVVNIGILQHDISTEAMEYLSKCIEKKKTINEFTCRSCSKAVPTRCVQCEACLLWFHFKCVGFKRRITQDSNLKFSYLFGNFVNQKVIPSKKRAFCDSAMQCEYPYIFHNM